MIDINHQRAGPAAVVKDSSGPRRGRGHGRKPRTEIWVSSRTRKPFARALRALKKVCGLTYRELAQNTRQLDGRGLTAEYINALATGRERPSIRAIELLARACDVQPDYFVRSEERRRGKRR